LLPFVHCRRRRPAHLGATRGWTKTTRPASSRKTEKDTVPFTALRDHQGRLRHGRGFLLFFAWFVFYTPNYLGDPDNYIPANPGLSRRRIIVPEMVLPAVLRHPALESRASSVA